jgi:hypothetical protein
MTTKIAHGRTRTLDLDQTGINGSGCKVWIVWTHNADGTLHHMERFTSKSEAIAWMKWA